MKDSESKIEKTRKKTGGRVVGTKNKRTAAVEAAVAASGLTPLEYMLQVLNDVSNPLSVRLDASKGAAPYVHAKLASVEVSGKDGAPLQVQIVDYASQHKP